MKETRLFLARFALYDKTGICKFLKKKAARGWMLDEMGVLFWKFKHIESQQLKFSVIYFKNASEYDPKLPESQLRFQEYCEYTGWEFAASRGETLVYYSEDEDALPLETDPVVEVKSVHSVMWRRWLLPYLWLGFSHGYRLFEQLKDFGYDPITCMKIDYVSLLIIQFLVAFFFLTEALEYLVWYIRATRIAKNDGRFLSTKNFSNVKYIVNTLIILATFFVSALVTGDFSIAFELVGVILLAAVMLATYFGTTFVLKKLNAPRTLNRIITLTLSAVVVYVCLTDGTKLITENISANNAVEQFEEQYITEDEFSSTVPLETADFILGEVKVEKSVVQERKNLSVAELRAQQKCVDVSSGEEYKLVYTVFDIKIPFVRGLCVNKWFKQYFVFDNFLDRTGVSLDRVSHREIVADVWLADEAYILCVDGKAINRYLLCYGNKIVEFIPSWELTAEQVKVVAETFG